MKRSAVRLVAIALLSALCIWLMVGCAATLRNAAVLESAPVTGGQAPPPLLDSTVRKRIDEDPRANRATPLLPAQSLPSRDEELWVIARPPEERAAPRSETPLPGEGRLFAVEGENRAPVPLPLKHTDVSASILGYIASVDVKQQYQNTAEQKIEAVYVFPLPQNAAVSDFLMTVGSRHIRGIIRERHEAEQIYQEAKSQGYVASLLTQERPNVFTQAIANIEPGRQLDVEIKYFNTLSYADGAYEFVFPMVVGPRFNPPGFEGGALSQIQYTQPEQRSGQDISLSVDIDAGVPIDHIDSRNHRIQTRPLSPTKTRVTLDPQDNIPNRDFVLRYQVAGDKVMPALLAQPDGSGGYFTLMLFPPKFQSDLPRQPLEFVFTIDVSGSQAGLPLEQEKAATRYALMHLGPEDTFQVIRFGNTAQKLFPAPRPASPDAVRTALQWVDSFDATEGTMLIDGLHASLLFPHDPARTRCVAFMTDGFIGNDAEAIAETRRCIGPAHVFSLGVGQSTNRYLLDGLARAGRGAVAYLGLNDDAGQMMSQYFDRVSHPALTDITIDWSGAKVRDVFPREVPDLYVGRPVVLTGRYDGPLPKSVTLRARLAGREQTIEVPVQTFDSPLNPKALPAVWARMKIADLSDQAVCDSSVDLPSQIRRLAMEYNLMSAYTAFIAVDSTTRTAQVEPTRVAVPVALPQGSFGTAGP